MICRVQRWRIVFSNENIKKKNYVYFEFIIKLHIDDVKALEFIKNRLNCGVVYINGKFAILFIRRLDDLIKSLILIPHFVPEKFPLNGAKYLDYLAFKEAIFIKMNDSISACEKLKLIRQLKNSMNTKRKNFDMPSSHTIRITPYYLLAPLLYIPYYFFLKK